MNKNALKKFAMEARERLIEQVTLRADYYGLTENCSKRRKSRRRRRIRRRGAGSC